MAPCCHARGNKQSVSIYASHVTHGFADLCYIIHPSLEKDNGKFSLLKCSWTDHLSYLYLHILLFFRLSPAVIHLEMKDPELHGGGEPWSHAVAFLFLVFSQQSNYISLFFFLFLWLLSAKLLVSWAYHKPAVSLLNDNNEAIAQNIIHKTRLLLPSSYIYLHWISSAILLSTSQIQQVILQHTLELLQSLRWLAPTLAIS